MNDLVQSIFYSIRQDNSYNWLVCEGISEKIYFEYFLQDEIKNCNLNIIPMGGQKEVSKLYEYLNVPIKNEAKSLKDIFKTNIKPDGKYIYFCPVMSEKGKNDIETIAEEVKTWIEEMGLTSEEYKIYITTSKMGKEGKLNRKAFYNDEDIKGNKVNNKLRIMLAINQYNEGVHAPGIDGVIMGRGTSSDIVFFEQLGRALSVRGKTKEEYEELSKKTKEELIEICERREIEISDTNTKEKIIEQILAPVIIDLAGNIGFIKELENNLKSRVREIQERKSGSKRKIHIDNTSFDINLLNEDIFEILKYVIDRLSTTWMDKYELAKKYYEHYGNLDIPIKFKTINGIDYDENGIALGIWISTQRQTKDRLTNFQIDLLENIGMKWNVSDENWNIRYELAKKYYEHYGNLDIPQKFKTINGIDYDENGIALGVWISVQRTAYKGHGSSRLTNSQIELLESIGMIFISKTVDKKLQSEEISEKNIKEKRIELLNRSRTLLNSFDSNTLPNKNDINEKFIEQLNNIKK